MKTLLLRVLQSSLVAVVSSVLSFAMPAHAAVGTADVVPAATLLLPYFEVDLANENGAQTSIRISNTSASAGIVNVTLWTDLGVPTYSFPVYFTGYDTEEIDLRLVFKGILPVTATAGQDPTDRISPKGTYSQDINFGSCNGILPFAGRLAAATVTALRNAHTGQSSTLLSGNCGGVARGDNIARGFVTVDDLVACPSGAFPSDANFFQNFGGTRNIFTGTVTYLNRSQNFASSEPMVHIEASMANPLTSTGAGKNTFYGRFVAFGANDNREPTPSSSQIRFLNGGTLNLSTDMVVWRDPGQAIPPFACGGSLPAPFPLSQTQVVAFDEQENPTLVTGNPFPYVAQRVAVSSLTNKTAGFLRLILTRSGDDAAITGRQQSVVSAQFKQNGTYAGSVSAAQLANGSESAGSNYTLPLGN